MGTILSVDTDGITTCADNGSEIMSNINSIKTKLVNVSIPEDCANTTIIENLETAKEELGTIITDMCESINNIRSLNNKLIYAEQYNIEIAGNLSEGIATNDIICQKIIEIAEQQLGDEYTLGTDGPDEFDCSGFVWYVYNEVWKEVYGEEFIYDRTTADNIGANWGTTITSSTDSGGINYEEISVGDILYFSGHVGIYIGDGQFIHASSGRDEVVISDLSKYEIQAKKLEKVIRIVNDED